MNDQPDDSAASPSSAGRSPPGSGLSPLREVTRLALPAALGLLSYALMQSTDAVFLGHHDTTDQAGVGLTFLLVWSLMCPLIGSLTGVNTFTAQYVGAGRLRRAGRHIRSVLIAASIVALPYFALAALAPNIMSLYGEGPMVDAGTAYLRIRLCGTVFVAISMASGAFFRGTGDAVTPLLVSLAANAVNLVLDYLLIFGAAGMKGFGLPGIPGTEALGVEGAAIATVSAQAFEAIAFLWILSRSRRIRRDYRVSWRGRLHLREIQKLIRVGGPIGLYWITEAGAWAVFFHILGGFGDEAIVAANYAAFNIFHFSFLPVVGLLMAAQTLVGQYIGAGDPETARRRGFLCMRLGVITMTTMGVIMVVFRHSLIALFNPDPAVVAAGAAAMIYVAILQPFDAMGMTAIGSLRGAGDTMFCWVAVAACAWLVFLPLSWAIAFPLNGGPAAAWIGAIVFLMLLAAMATHRLRGRRWEDRSV